MRALRPVFVLVLAAALGSSVRADEERPAVRLDAVRTFEAGQGIVRSLGWTPDGVRFAAGCSDRTLRIWNAKASEPVVSVTIPRSG